MMPPLHPDVARHPAPIPTRVFSQRAQTRRQRPRPPRYASLLCPTLARALGKSRIDRAIAATPRSGAELFLARAVRLYEAQPRHRAAAKPEFKLLRALLRDAPSQRLVVAKHCYALLGANLGSDQNLRGVRTLRAAAAFGASKLARIVAQCMPVTQAPERRLAMLEGLWQRLGAARLPYLMQVCEPMLEQRRGAPHQVARAMERILQLCEQAHAAQAAQDALGQRQLGEFDLSNIEENCQGFLGDNRENVMLSSRIVAARRAIDIVRSHVPEALHYAGVLGAVELFVEGMAQNGCEATRALCAQALQTLTGNHPGEVQPWSASAEAPEPHADPHDILMGSPLVLHFGDRGRLWRNIRLEVEDAEPIGMGELCSLIWQCIHRFRDPEQSLEQNRQTQGNMRYALVRALADCHEEGGIVCPVGISQRLLTVLQGYLPYTIDGVEQAAHPQAVVTYLLQSFAHQLAQEQAMRSEDNARPLSESQLHRRIERFYRAARQSGAELFAGRPQEYDTFKRHLVTGTQHCHDAYWLEDEGL